LLGVTRWFSFFFLVGEHLCAIETRHNNKEEPLGVAAEPGHGFLHAFMDEISIITTI
jgi:hypothetical protein